MLHVDPSQSPEALLGDIHAFIAKTQAQIEARGNVSLDGLDVAVAALCKQILTLEENESKQYSAKLTELMEAIEAMQANMMKLQGEIAATIKALAKQKKAAHAYIKAPRAED